MAFQSTPDYPWPPELSIDILMDFQAEHIPLPFVDDMNIAESNDYAQNYVLNQYSSLTPRVMQNRFVVDHPSENSSLSQASSKIDNPKHKRKHDQSFSQQDEFDLLLDDKDWYPTTQQKDNLSSERLKRSQVDGHLSRVRQAYGLSIIANKGSVGANSKNGLSSDHSDCGQEEKELYKFSDEVEDGNHDVRLEYHNGPPLEWWFKTYLPQIGSHMVYEGHADAMARDLESLDSSHSTCSSSSSGDLLSRHDTNSEWSLLMTLSIGHHQSRKQGRRVCPGSRISRVSSNGSTSSGVLYYCTFCDFISESCGSWCRHELETHVRESAWICQPSITNVQNVQVCSFCDHDMNSPLCSHQAQTRKCWASKSRDFQRLEQLKGHLKRVHRLGKAHADSVALKFTPDGEQMRSVDLTCYFCDESPKLATWKARAHHVGNHYRFQKRTRREWDTRRAIFTGQRLFQNPV